MIPRIRMLSLRLPQIIRKTSPGGAEPQSEIGISAVSNLAPIISEFRQFMTAGCDTQTLWVSIPLVAVCHLPPVGINESADQIIFPALAAFRDFCLTFPLPGWTIGIMLSGPLCCWVPARNPESVASSQFHSLLHLPVGHTCGQSGNSWTDTFFTTQMGISR